jgi:hypothetical protein
MTQADDSNVTRFPAPPPPPSPVIEDEWVFRMICDWRIARAQQTIAWAEYERGTLADLHEDPKIKHTADALETMETVQYDLRAFEPRSILTARAMLEMATEILAWQQINPEHPFANGPVLDLVRNARNALDWLPPATPLGAKA